jgi:hypothetical protein
MVKGGIHKKGRSREIEKTSSKEAPNRVRLTTKIDKTLLGQLRRLALKKGKSLSELLEEAVKNYWNLK